MASSLTDHLRALPDSALITLLGRRPDLVTPPPTDVTPLAARAPSRVSVPRALDAFDRFPSEFVDACRLARDRARDDTVSMSAIVALINPADVAPARAAVDRLRELMIVYGRDEALHVVAAVDEVPSPYPAGL